MKMTILLRIVAAIVLFPAIARPAVSPKPTILIFSKGSDCVYCNAQYQAFESLRPVLSKYGIKVRFLGEFGSARDDTNNSEREIAIVSDPQERARVAKQMGVPVEVEHALFVLNAGNGVVFKNVSATPNLNAAVVVGTALQTIVKVELQFNCTPIDTDDYLTWAPMLCRIRLIPGDSISQSVTVVLTNDPENIGTLSGNGNMAFDSQLAAGQTATQPSLSLVLPVDGTWVNFYAAGSFPRASAADKDAVVEVHLDTEAGPLLGSHAAMIRIRKNVDALNEAERRAYTRALHDLHFSKRGYEVFTQMHDLAAKGKFPYNQPLPDGSLNPKFYPDQAHEGSGFLPWHRAFLLLMERELQKINPAVTIPYWRQNVATQAMTPSFLGGNQRRGGAFQTEVLFAPTNWLYGWNIKYQNLKTVVRSPKDGSFFLRSNGKRLLAGDTEFFPNGVPIHDDFGKFTGEMENNPHNAGHGAIGAWHANCLISPSDPSFWSFHAEDDRLWAMWQYLLGRFETNGNDALSYDRLGVFQPDSPKNSNLGHYLNDKMWPWDGSKGTVIPDKEGKGRRPNDNPFQPFPASAIAGLWPSGAAHPRPADMIDLWGLRSGQPHGVSYDDIPYGTRPVGPTLPVAEPAAGAELLIEVANDRNVDLDRRTRAFAAVQSAHSALSIAVAERIASDTTTPFSLRSIALREVFIKDPEKAILELTQASLEPGAIAAFAKNELVAQAPFAHLARLSTNSRFRLHATLAQISSEPDAALASRATIALAAMSEKSAVSRLKTLAKMTQTPIPRAELVAALAPADIEPPLMRDVLALALSQNDEDTVIVILRAMAGDADSKTQRLGLASTADKYGPFVQIAALRSLMFESPDVIRVALEFLEARDNSADILINHLEACGVIRVAIESMKPFPKIQVQDWKSRMERLQTNLGASGANNAADLRLLYEMAIQMLNDAGL